MPDIYSFTVNGVPCATAEEKPLLRYLRDDLHLHSVKDGCSEGACGTCTVIADGKAVKSCVMSTKRAAGKAIVTVEGLPDAWKEAFVYAFGVSGSVQCGFCTPGMVMAGKALLDQNPDPSEDEIRAAIKGNLCRCTGYRKVIDGIRLAGAILRGEVKIDPDIERGDNYGVGQRAFRVDVRDKVLGTGRYPDDVEMEGMAHLLAVRSEYARARVLSIDAGEALAMEGVIGVLTAEDVPHNKVGHLQQDWDVMIPVGGVTRCVGDAICLVVAETEEILKKAREKVRIEYEVLKPVTSISEAMAPDAPKVHSGGNLCQRRHVTRGDAKAALAASAHTVTKSFSTPFTEHAFLEPECAVAFPYKDGVKILSSDQGVYDTRREVALMFGWEPECVVVENMLVGGGFGGKEDVSVQHICALAAWKYRRPVKARFSRQESIRFHPKRHAMEGTFTLGCDENGVFTGLDCDIYFDTGAYASLCGPVLERACTHAVGPYCYQNTDIRGYGYYTNNPPAGAFRGFGVSQSEFALESMINLLAEEVGISPWEIRYRNAIEPGKALPNGQIADCSTALKETLLAVKDVYEANRGRAGIACAMKNAGVGVGLPDKGRARLTIEDGVCVIYCAASDIGQGCRTVFCQDVAQATGLPLSKIRNGSGSTEDAPDSGTTSGSRQTLLSGEAVRTAALQLKAALDEAGGDLGALNGRSFFYEYYEPTDKLGADVPNPKSHIAYGYATHVVILDDDGRVKAVYAAHDSGKVVNPIAIQGQIEGGVLMSMGYALTEDFPLKDGVPTAKLGTLGLLRATQIPDIHAIYVEKETLLPVAWGAKGIGEIAAIPTAPAIQGAYYALDGVFRTKLPLENTWYRHTNHAKRIGDLTMKTLVHGGTIVTENNLLNGDILIENGRILEVSEHIAAPDAEIIDAAGRLVLPGAVDIHTHMDLDVGIARVIDDFYTGTVAAACGGTTTIVDHMAFGPKGCSPWHQVQEYHRLADGVAAVDYGFHGVLQHVNDGVLDDMAQIADREGITSFKVYMTYDYRLDDLDLMRLLERANLEGILIAAHCENHGIVTALRERFVAEGKTQAAWHPVSRPPEAEAEAVYRLLCLAHAAGDAPVYVVHLSSRLGLEALRRAKAAGQRHIGAETCPQYLLLDEALYADPAEGLKAIMAPPLRRAGDRAALWEALSKGELDTVATDHCPFTFARQKQQGADDFTKCPSGAPGVEERLILLYSEGVVKGRITLPQLVKYACANPARIAGLYPRKGTIEPGADADLVILDPDRKWTLTTERMHGNSDYSCYEGMEITGAVERVLLRGSTVALDGEFTGRRGGGQYLRRGKSSLV